MKILILGSKGQIGEHLYNYLKEKNYKVVGLDIVNSKSEDLRNKNNKKFNNLITKVDFIFFLAFDVGGSVYLKNYQNTYNFLMNNTAIINNVFEKIKKNKKKFIFASSQMSNMSYSSYGVLKRVGENFTSSLNGITVKFWNVFGIENDPKKTHVITDFILKGMQNNKIKMLTNGLEERDFMYAEDCCAALEFIMKKYDNFKYRNHIDLNTGQSTKIRNVAKIISKLFLKNGKKVDFIPANNKDGVQMNKKNKADRFLFRYWKPKFSLEEEI